MHALYRLFRINRLSTIQLNRVLVWCMLIPALLSLLLFCIILFILAEEFALPSGADLIVYLPLILICYLIVRIFTFRKRHWWSWIVLTFVFLGGFIFEVVSNILELTYWFNQGEIDILLEGYGYIGFSLYLLVQIISFLLNVYIVLGLTSRRIAGYHGIGKIAFTITVALGGVTGILALLLIFF